MKNEVSILFRDSMGFQSTARTEISNLFKLANTQRRSNLKHVCISGKTESFLSLCMGHLFYKRAFSLCNLCPAPSKFSGFSQHCLRRPLLSLRCCKCTVWLLPQGSFLSFIYFDITFFFSYYIQKTMWFPHL